MKTSLLTVALISTAITLTFAQLPAAYAGTLSLPAYSADSFQQAEAKGSFVLVATKPGCPVCSKQIPVIESTLQLPEFANLTVLQYNQVTEKALNKRFGVTGQSTIIVYRDGVEVSRTRGLTEADAIKTELMKAL